MTVIQRTIAQVLAEIDASGVPQDKLVPTAESDRKWYAIGYQLAPDRDLSDLMPETVPPVDWIWYALGVRDWKQSQKPRAWWTKAEPSSSPAAIAVNVAAGVVPTTGTPQKADDISVLPAVGGGVAIVAGAILLGVAWKRRKARRR